MKRIKEVQGENTHKKTKDALEKRRRQLKIEKSMPSRNARSQVGNYEGAPSTPKAKVPAVGDSLFYYPRHGEASKIGSQPLPAICMCSGDMSPELTIFTSIAEIPVIVKRTVMHVNDWNELTRLNDPDWVYAANGYWSYNSTETK